MRARNLKPGFFQNEQLAELEVEARLLFLGLTLIADREGRLEDRPKRIKMLVFPADTIDVEPLLDGLEKQKLIVRYEVAGNAYIWIPTFTKHQKPHPREAESTIPTYQGIAEATPRRGPDNEKELSGPAESLNPESLNPSSLKKTRKARVSPQWKPDESLLSWLQEKFPDLDADELTESFLDYHIARGTTMADWNRAFQTWARNADRFAKQGPRNGAGRKTLYETAMEQLDREIANG